MCYTHVNTDSSNDSDDGENNARAIIGRIIKGIIGGTMGLIFMSANDIL